MTRGAKSGNSGGQEWRFIRRASDDCAIIALHPDREEVIPSRMAIADAGRAAAGVPILSHAAWDRDRSL
jgi:hypothetical protein